MHTSSAVESSSPACSVCRTQPQCQGDWPGWHSVSPLMCSRTISLIISTQRQLFFLPLKPAVLGRKQYGESCFQPGWTFYSTTHPCLTFPQVQRNGLCLVWKIGPCALI
ncbi:hypothetical protein AVEN_270314-1 [Araneus ventricosus]|uniref:Uncharacterized protein n=1 Tax=Araneus ventricosus TaxID=182803 RepID=A0A4Y2PGJ0_ARAVE|nr:hypothetical protein AVEN_270314-1 [Araneus ventricosus]